MATKYPANISPFEPHYIKDYLAIEQELMPADICFSKSRFQDILSREDVISYAAMQDDKIVGYCLLQMAMISRKLIIIELNVAKQSQRQGIGSQLMQTILQSANHLACNHVLCQIFADDTAAVEFLKKHNFQATKTLADFLIKSKNGLEMVLDCSK